MGSEQLGNSEEQGELMGKRQGDDKCSAEELLEKSIAQK